MLKDKAGIEKTYQDIKTILVNNDQNSISTFIEQPTQQMRCFLAGKDSEYFDVLKDNSTSSSSDDPSWPIALTTTGDDDIDVVIFGYGAKEGDNNYPFAVITGSSSSIFTITNATDTISNNVVGLILCYETISSSVINSRTGFSSSNNYQVNKGWNILLGTKTGINDHIEVSSVIASDLVGSYSPIFVNFKLPISIYDNDNFYGKLFISTNIQEIYSKTYTSNGTDIVHPESSYQGFGVLEITNNVSGGSGNYEDLEDNTDTNGWFDMTPSSGYDALSSASVHVKVTKCYMLSDPNGSMPAYDNGFKIDDVGYYMTMFLINAIPDDGIKNTVLLLCPTYAIWWSDGDQTISEIVMNQLFSIGGAQWTAGALVLASGWNYSDITFSGSTIIEAQTEAITRTNLNSRLGLEGYIPYGYKAGIDALDDYAKSFFKLVEFKDE